MNTVPFTGPILSGHKQAAMEVPFDPSQRWGIAASAVRPGRRGHDVLAGVHFQSVVVSRSKRFWVLIEQAQLEAAGVSVGESVTISLEPLVDSKNMKEKGKP